MTALSGWVRWEIGRRIQLNGVIVYIICERFVKAAILVGGGIALLVVAAHNDLRGIAEEAQRQLVLSAGISLWQRALDNVLTFFGSHPDSLALSAIAYGLLEITEAVGLILRRRWAEYLVFLATVVFLPLEVHALVRAQSVLRVLTLAVNVAIAVYLVWRKQLFLARERSIAQAA